jgi:phosphoglycolate phosphatase-like HAD superfamily hydrolase
LSSAGTLNARSPNPTCSLSAPCNSGAPPEDCYVVGDAVWDLLAARAGRNAEHRSSQRRLRRR